jgi:hypothetical protein
VDRFGPHGALAVAAGAAIALEAVRIETGSTVWLVFAAAVVCAGLVFAWRVQDRLRLVPLAAIAVSFHVAWIALNESQGAHGDQDPGAYFAYGDELLHGTYPETEYPVGAVLLFALEALLGGGSAEAPNRFLMVPFQLACVLAVWSLRTRHSSWLAAVIAVWPMTAYYWQYRFDLVPAALLVLGLLLASRGRWGWSGIALGLGTAVKWSPALAFVVLAAWLVASARPRELGRAAAGFAGAFGLLHLPFLLWAGDRVVDTYRGQGGRAITNESVWYIPLRALGLTGDDSRVWAPAGAPGWADTAAVAVQALLLLGLVALAVRARGHLGDALVFAALAPALFLLTNRVFSPQFFVVIAAALAFAGALAATHRAEQLALGGLLMAATFANAFVYPYEAPFGGSSWQVFSAVAFVAALVACGSILARAVRIKGEIALQAPAPDDPEAVDVAIRRARKALDDVDREAPTARVPRWAGRALRLSTAGLVVVFAVPTLFAAIVLPYRIWDSLAFGSWSRSIAEGNGLWDNAVAFNLSRPLFYVPQGLAWRLIDDGDWVGRLWSVVFAAALVAAVWLMAVRLTEHGVARAFTGSLAVGVLLGSAVFAGLVAAGMTDVPVAAGSAATALMLWQAPRRPLPIALIAACAAATVLAKASGLLALAGLVAAGLLLHRVRALPGVAAASAGAGVALVYDAWQASRIDMPFTDFIRAGNEPYWLARGAAARWDALARAEWLGAGVRLLVLYGLVHAVLRVAGLRPRWALGVAGVAALVWSVAGPAIADERMPYPLDGSVIGLLAWLALLGAMALAPLLADRDPIGRTTYGALLLWLAPTGLVWAWQRADEVRHLAPAWPPLVLLAAAALASVSLALSRLRPPLALLPAAAVATIAVANVPSIDGLGREGWRGLLNLGSSGWSSKAAVENYAYGPFSYELDLARENVGPTDRLVSSNGRLAYFFPGRVEVAYARTCSELEGARFFSYLTAGESLVLAQSAGQPLDPLGWLQCSEPRLELVGEQQGIYAAFVVGGPPARPPTPEDCRIAPAGGQDVDAIFGDGLTYGEAKALRKRAFDIGYIGGLRLERTGCSTFRVVVTGVPADEAFQARFRRDARQNGFEVSYAAGTRFPEVPPDVEAVR